jgi:hypothetical protein
MASRWDLSGRSTPKTWRASSAYGVRPDVRHASVSGPPASPTNDSGSTASESRPERTALFGSLAGTGEDAKKSMRRHGVLILRASTWCATPSPLGIGGLARTFKHLERRGAAA